MPAHALLTDTARRPAPEAWATPGNRHRYSRPRTASSPRSAAAPSEDTLNAQTHSELANFIWDICNLLRGPYKRNEYRKVILPLTVL
ncbi:MAG: type I restriction-modification system subunit M N-terminal domain-containing protein, partial [Acidimicrobiaceae bacterium]|nr:type I restriction-modification system subunit M N-terminal domain-containing protein [Acidimicrobiaceae bacterium]